MRLKSIDSQSAVIAQAIALGGLLLVGLGLRFWHLDAKPLWLDEVLTALFTTGHRFQDVPLNQFFPLSALDSLFAYRSGLSCAQIAQTVATESVHPPIFFCLIYQWLGWLKPNSEGLVWAIRAIPALMGVGAIAAIYLLNRLAFSPAAGLLGAALMAVSPFAVYLSQEARHYTLPMLLITLSLAALVELQRDLATSRLRPLVWLSWVGMTLLSLYVHYFCVLALVAQVMALLIWLVWQRRPIARRAWSAIALSLTGIFLGYLPWLPILLSHFRRPETDWLIPYNPNWLDRLAPLYQTLLGWTLMFVALPVEKQPTPLVVVLAVVSLGFMSGLIWQISRGMRRLWQEMPYRSAIVLLSGFTLCVIGEFLAIAYLLNKDLTVVPRYNFVYYPGVCALAAASLAKTPTYRSAARPSIILLLVGLFSSLLVVNGWVFLKSYTPDRVAKNMTFEPSTAMAVVVAYDSLQEVALGLSFALQLHRPLPDAQPAAERRFAFVDQTAGYQQAWKTLAQMPQLLPLPLNLWVVASPGMRTDDYPNRLRVSYSGQANRQAKVLCAIDPAHYHRVGFPYQLFRCPKRSA